MIEAAMSDVVVVIERAAKIDLSRFFAACTIQIVLLSIGDVLEKSIIASRSRYSEQQTSRTRELYVHFVFRVHYRVYSF